MVDRNTCGRFDQNNCGRARVYARNSHPPLRSSHAVQHRVVGYANDLCYGSTDGLDYWDLLIGGWYNSSYMDTMNRERVWFAFEEEMEANFGRMMGSEPGSECGF